MNTRIIKQTIVKTKNDMNKLSMYKHNPDAVSIFKEHIKGNNLVTPNVLSILFSNKNTICELTYGYIFGDIIYGVTVLSKISDIWMHSHDLSQSFHSEEAVINYIEKLKYKNHDN